MVVETVFGADEVALKDAEVVIVEVDNVVVSSSSQSSSVVVGLALEVVEAVLKLAEAVIVEVLRREAVDAREVGELLH